MQCMVVTASLVSFQRTETRDLFDIQADQVSLNRHIELIANSCPPQQYVHDVTVDWRSTETLGQAETICCNKANY